MSARLLTTMATLDDTMKTADRLVARIDGTIAPQISATLAEAQAAMHNAQQVLGQDAPLQNDLERDPARAVSRREIVARIGRIPGASPRIVVARQAGRPTVKLHLGFPVACSVLLIAACAGAPDHFYTLNALPDSGRATPPSIHVRLNVTVPSLIDRNEMVLDAPKNGILILEHERWGAPLSDQVLQTLARDMEQVRRDLIVADRRFDQAASPPISFKVDVVRMAAQRGGQAALEAHWRMIDAGAGIDQIGSESFSAPVDGDDYAAIAKAYSRLLAELAAKLAAGVRR